MWRGAIITNREAFVCGAAGGNRERTGLFRGNLLQPVSAPRFTAGRLARIVRAAGQS
jgi:hypothetical protein